MHYGCYVRPAMNEYNDTTDNELNPLDARILLELSEVLLGFPALKLREQCADRRTIFSATFNRSVNRLLDLKLITKRKHRKWVYYTITMKGRNTLEQLNTNLAKIVNDKLAALNK